LLIKIAPLYLLLLKTVEVSLLNYSRLLSGQRSCVEDIDVCTSHSVCTVHCCMFVCMSVSVFFTCYVHVADQWSWYIWSLAEISTLFVRYAQRDDSKKPSPI